MMEIVILVPKWSIVLWPAVDDDDRAFMLFLKTTFDANSDHGLGLWIVTIK